MKRRKALKQIGLGLSAGLFIPPFLTSCKKDDPGPKVPYDGVVAVIGAGASGLYAADILNSLGVKVIVLEAGSQIGGRIRSLRNQKDVPTQSLADFPIELGAEIVYGTDSSWGKIIKALNLETVDIAAVGVDQFILENIAKASADWQSESDFVAAQNFVNTLPNYSGPATTVKDATSGFSSRTQTLLNSQVGNFYGTSNDKLGIKGLSQALNAQTHDGKLLTVKANPWQDIILSRFSLVKPLVQLNTPVKAINYGSDPIVITLKDGSQIEANKVIVTVPVSILKSGGISFSPSLPGEMTSALSKIGMDPCVKVVLDFKKNFWVENAGFIWGGVTAPQYFSAGVGRSEFYRTLSITVQGAKATELSAKGPDMVLDILEELDTIYNGQGTLFIRRDLNTDQMISFIQDWNKEEYIKGGFSYPFASATSEDRIALSKPVSDKLFFAGEATDIYGDVGSVNGALSSAERVTEEVVISIQGVS